MRQVDCGVPQGLSLSPLPFLVYVNDLSLVSQFSTIRLANGTPLALSDGDLAKLESRVDVQLQNIDWWLNIIN